MKRLDTKVIRILVCVALGTVVVAAAFLAVRALVRPPIYFGGFLYDLQVRDDSGLVVHQIALHALEYDEPSAPVLYHARLTYRGRGQSDLSEPDFSAESIKLDRAHVRAIECAIRAWKPPSDTPRNGRPAPSSVSVQPRAFFQADFRRDKFSGDFYWQGWDVDALGLAECSKLRRLINSINQAMPASIRQHHALPVPPGMPAGKESGGTQTGAEERQQCPPLDPRAALGRQRL